MNKYGIREMENFKAPRRKPWIVILIALVLGLCIWLVAHLAGGGRDSVRGSDGGNAKPAAQLADTADKARKSAARNSAIQKPATNATAPKVEQPAVDLKTEKKPVTSKAAKSALARALELIDKNDRIAARGLLQKALENELPDPQRAEIERGLVKINTELVFLPYEMPEKLTHVVKRGDSLGKLAKEYGITIDSIQVINGIKNPNHIRPDDILKILDGDYSIAISRGSLKLTVYMNGKFFKSYPIAIGKFDKTPAGTFEIVDRLKNPVW